MKYFLFLICLFGFVWIVVSIDCNKIPKNTEGRLKKKILCDYDKSVRPVNNHKKTISVESKFSIKSYKFNEWYEDPKLKINMWMKLNWNDNHLVWNPNEYNDINSIGISSNDIWMPQLSVINYDMNSPKSLCHRTDCNLYYEGNITCTLPCTQYSICTVDFKRWPYDRQICLLKIGSLSETENLNLTKKGHIKASNEKIINNEFKLISTTLEYSMEMDILYNRTFPMLTLSLYFERYSSFHATLITFPALVLIFIDLISLWLEPGCKDRFFLNVLSIFSHLLFFKHLSWIVPKNGSTNPSIVTFAVYNLFLSILLIINTIITRSIVQSKRLVSSRVKQFVNIMSSNHTALKYFRASNINEGLGFVLYKNENPIWISFAKLIDRIIFLLFVILYVIMYFIIYPTSYGTSEPFK